MKHLKKIGALLLTVLLLAGMALSVRAEEGPKLLYEYDPATASEVWSSFTGNWTYDENGISVTNDGNDVWFYTYMGVDKGWTDYVIEVDLVNVAEGGVIFRSTNPGPGVDSFGGYIMAYDSAYAFVGMDDNDCWKTLPDDGPDAPAASALGYANEQHWKIEVKGNTYTMYVDNVPIPFVQVVDDTYTQGGIGLRFKVFEGDESGYFTNIKVYELAEEPAATDPPATDPPATDPPATPPKQTEPAPTEPAPTEPAGFRWVWVAVGGVAAAAVAVGAVIAVKKKKA